jgi:hypothetical protein
MDLTSILDDCLRRLQAGETVESCLALYPDRAADLRPMLAVVLPVKGLTAYHLSHPQRLRAKVTLRETLATRPGRPWWLSWNLGLSWARGAVAAAVVAVILFISLGVNAVAASQPGDLAYRLRVVVERVPATLQTSPASRASAELTVADRRLADLDSHLATTGRPDETALAALLAGDETAAENGRLLADGEPRERLADRVTTHADRLTRLAQAAPDPLAAETLNAAAERAYAIAERLRRGLPADGPVEPPPRQTPPTATPTPAPATGTPSPTPTATASASATPTGTATPTGAEIGTASPTETASPAAMETPTRPTPERTRTPGWRATAIAETVTVHPRPTRTADPTRQPSSTDGARPAVTPTPGRRATAIVATLTALPPLPTAIATRLTQAPEPTRGSRRGEPPATPTAEPPAVTPQPGAPPTSGGRRQNTPRP